MDEDRILSKDDIKELLEKIRYVYQADSIPWVVGYSGGKDSTAVLQAVWMALAELPAEHRTKPVHVISTDTLVESPVVAAWVMLSHTRIAEAAREQGLPIEPHRLTPKTDNTFWVNLLGRGYPAPRPGFRWCTVRLKIEPSNRFIKEVVAENGEAIVVLGTRKSESAARAKVMDSYEKHRARSHLSPNGSLDNSFVFSPIEDWSDDNVWQFLMQYKNPWGHSNRDLLTMYRGASPDGECPLQISTDTPSCGKSRFGCWVCTMVDQDKSMQAMIQNDDEKLWMTPLLEFRNEIGDWDRDRDRREFVRANGRLKLLSGRLVHGPYKREVRHAWLRKLLLIERGIQTEGPEEFRDLRLITDDELKAIRRIWLMDKHEFDDAAVRIYREVTQRPFPDEHEFRNNTFGPAEWKALEETCVELYPDEEMLLQMQSYLLDIERKSLLIGLRRGILNSLEDAIRRFYYRDEADAEAVAKARFEYKQELEELFAGDVETEEELDDYPAS